MCDKKEKYYPSHGLKSNNDTLLFSVGPVEMDPEIRRIGCMSLPYFRTKEFSDMNLEIASLIRQFVCAEENSEVVLLTASGTGAMGMGVIDSFGERDKLLVIAGGTLGKRFVEDLQSTSA